MALKGFTPLYMINGADYNRSIETCVAIASDSSVFGVGSPVKLASTEGVLGDDGNYYNSVVASAAGDVDYGICVGIDPVTVQSLPYRVASTLTKVRVLPLQGVVFGIQEDSVGGSLALTDCNSTIDYVIGSPAVNVLTGIGDVMLDSSTVHATTGAFRLLRPARIPGNVIGTNCIWEVIAYTDALAGA